MVGSYEESEDLVQETLVRAWSAQDQFEGRAALRTWLYRIASNVCLDFLRHRTRRPQSYERIPGVQHGSSGPPDRLSWLQPYPDRLLEDLPSSDAQPDAAAVTRETIELAFVAAIQHLPPRQRAVLIARDVLGWSTPEVAAMLQLSPPSVTSALQRARGTLRRYLPPRRAEWASRTSLSDEERQILDRYVAAAKDSDTAAMAAMLAEDARLTMPPNPYWFVGRTAILEFVSPVFDASSPRFFGDWRHLKTSANRQPAAAAYVRRPGTGVFRAQVLDVLRVEDGVIAEITSFEPHLFAAFGLPSQL